MQLHDYQEEVVAGAVELWRAGHRRIAAVMATGAGKTVTFSHVAKMALDVGTPVLVLAHRRELLHQAVKALSAVNPGARIGLMQGRSKQFRADIVVGSVQTASTPASLALLKMRQWGLIIVDECHHSTAATYVRVLKELGAYTVDGTGPRVLGVTATLDRADGQALGQVFEEIIEPRVGLLDLIKRGFLVPPRGVRVKIAELNLDKVRRVAGDFNSGALGRAMSDAMAPKRIVESYIEHCPDAPAVVFMPSVAISMEQAQAFRDAGISAVHLDGGTPDDVRDKAIEEFRAGKVQVLCNVGLFLEGTDLPRIRCVILGRPTSSTTVYVQQVGRGLRLDPSSGKKFCWVLDVCGVTGRHKLATMASLDGAARPEDIPDDLLMYEEGEDDGEEPDDDGEEQPADVEYADGDTVHELVDLFGESSSTWLRTDGGIWFLPTPHGFVYLRDRADAPGRYDIDYQAHDGTSGSLFTDLDIHEAMAAGDGYVAAVPHWQLQRDAAWRRQMAPRAGRTRGEVYDDQQRRHASGVLDHVRV